jgi:hypothetical protein
VYNSWEKIFLGTMSSFVHSPPCVLLLTWVFTSSFPVLSTLQHAPISESLFPLLEKLCVMWFCQVIPKLTVMQAKASGCIVSFHSLVC